MNAVNSSRRQDKHRLIVAETRMMGCAQYNLNARNMQKRTTTVTCGLTHYEFEFEFEYSERAATPSRASGHKGFCDVSQRKKRRSTPPSPSPASGLRDKMVAEGREKNIG